MLFIQNTMEEEDAGNFSEGKATVSKTVDRYQEWAYINADNEAALDYQRYNSAEEGMLIVGEFQTGSLGLYDKYKDKFKKLLNNEIWICWKNGSGLWEKDAIPYTETKIIFHFTHNLTNCANYLGKNVLAKPRPGIL